MVLTFTHFFEAVIEGQIVSNRILPPGTALLVEGEVFGDILINLQILSILSTRHEHFVPGPV